jgi:hypothetical protein
MVISLESTVRVEPTLMMRGLTLAHERFWGTHR